MKTYLVIMLSLLSFFNVASPVLAMAPGILIEDRAYDEEYQAWAGPGYYYGIWFDNEATYNNWLNNQFYGTRWHGPDYYYGFWFDLSPDFYTYRDRHRNYSRGGHKGAPQHHQQQHRGHFKH